MRTENITSIPNGLFQSFEEKMRNKPMNYIIIIMGLILFLLFCFLKDNPSVSSSMNSTIIIGIAAIIGAMLTLFGLINLAAICCIHEREKKIFKEEQKN